LHAQTAVKYKDGNQNLNGISVVPKKAKASKPGILILPAWRGVDDHSKETAAKLGALGYHAFVADIYGEGKYPADTKQAGEMSRYYKKNYQEYQNRIMVALEQL